MDGWWWMLAVVLAVVIPVMTLLRRQYTMHRELTAQVIASGQALALIDQVVAHPQTPPFLRARCANFMRDYAVRFGVPEKDPRYDHTA